MLRTSGRAATPGNESRKKQSAYTPIREPRPIELATLATIFYLNRKVQMVFNKFINIKNLSSEIIKFLNYLTPFLNRERLISLTQFVVV